MSTFIRSSMLRYSILVASNFLLKLFDKCFKMIILFSKLNQIFIYLLLLSVLSLLHLLKEVLLHLFKHDGHHWLDLFSILARLLLMSTRLLIICKLTIVRLNWVSIHGSIVACKHWQQFVIFDCNIRLLIVLVFIIALRLKTILLIHQIIFIYFIMVMLMFNFIL